MRHALRRLLLQLDDPTVALYVAEPAVNATVAFPFDASGEASRGAVVSCFNHGSGSLLGTATATVGTWTITITGP